MGSSKAAGDFFKAFQHGADLRHIMDDFTELCAALKVKPQGPHGLYNALKAQIQTNEAQALFKLLEKRKEQPPYDSGKACLGYTILIIGAGPCGLRMAIEAALLGAHVVVIEKRDYQSRNNVLHMWPFVIHDLRLLGTKIFYPKFCVGNREHINTSRLQQVLLKIALVLGVEVHMPCSFEKIEEPTHKLVGKNKGWRVRVSPTGHKVENVDFDAVIGADGSKHALRVFKRKVFRGQMALGITANFQNENKQADADVKEIGGLFKVFNPPFFNRLKGAGIDLENFVYFKNDTHYFVMTAKKASLLKKGVLRADKDNITDLVSPLNINSQKLIEYVREATDIGTDGKIKSRELVMTHQGTPDVALFNFTSFHKAEHCCMAYERHGRKLLMSIIGDALLEPFWPTGTGVARGFLSTFDTAWLIKQWFTGEVTHLAALAERESVYTVLSQTSPEKLQRNLSTYTIDPSTRYGRELMMRTIKESEVKPLYRRTALGEWSLEEEEQIQPDHPETIYRRGSLQTNTQSEDLLQWYAEQLKQVDDMVDVDELVHSRNWASGVAFLAILSKYRPEYVDIKQVDPSNALTNVTKAFSLIESEYGVSPFVSPVEMVSEQAVDKLALLTYLAQLKVAIEVDEAMAARNAAKKKGVFGRRMSAIGMLLKVSKKDKEKKERHTIRRGEAKKMANATKKEKEDAILNAPPAGRRDSKSALCCICGDNLYVAERQTAHGYFFHKACFKCYKCNDQLWVTHAIPEEDVDGKVAFSCPWHGHIGVVSAPVMEVISEEERRQIDGEPGRKRGKGSIQGLDMVLEHYAEDDVQDYTTEHIKGMRRYSLQRSVQLMAAHDLQQQMQRAEVEEQHLADVGKEIEEDIRRQPALGHNKEANNRLTAEFLEVMGEKHKVQRRQQKLQLKAKMYDLRNMQSNLMQQMETIDEDDGDHEAKMTKIQTEMAEVQKMAAEIQQYLKDAEE